MENTLSQNALLQQRQLLSQRQQQSLELLQLPLLELEHRITEELAVNPLLEELPILQEDKTSKEPKEEQETPDSPENLSDTEAALTLWGDDLPRGSVYADMDDEGDFWSNSEAPPPSLEDQLASEIAISGVPERIQELAELIVSNLDDRGYLSSHLADLAMLGDADMEEMEKALALVQSFDPAGIAARDPGECLRLQLKRQNKLTPLLQALTEESSLEDLAANHLPRLAKKLKISIEELQEALGELKKLNPAPGAVLSSRSADIAEPEIEILRNGENYVVRTLHNRERRLTISKQYEKLLEDPATTPEARAYIEEKIRSARELLEALILRGDTLTGIGNVLIRTQQAFLDEGPQALKPLTMKQAGEMLGLNESTISRAVAGKTLRTPQGVYPLRFFFSSGFVNNDGEDVAARAVQEKIRSLIRAEDPHNPLSDDKLARLLAGDGLNVARRTIAKYRDILKIPSTRLRKKY